MARAAQSLGHDHVPARKFGLATARIDRQRLSEGGSWGANERVGTMPQTDYVFFSLGEMAEAVGAAEVRWQAAGCRRTHAQTGSSTFQRLYVGSALLASLLLASCHSLAHSSGSCSSLSGFERLRAMNPGNEPRPVGWPMGL